MSILLFLIAISYGTLFHYQSEFLRFTLATTWFLQCSIQFLTEFFEGDTAVAICVQEPSYSLLANSPDNKEGP